MYQYKCPQSPHTLTTWQREVYKIRYHLTDDHSRGDVLHWPGLFSQTKCLISVTITMGQGAIAKQVALAIAKWLATTLHGGREATQTEYIVPIAGEAIKSDAQPLKDAFDQNKEVRGVMLSRCKLTPFVSHVYVQKLAFTRHNGGLADSYLLEVVQSRRRCAVRLASLSLD